MSTGTITATTKALYAAAIELDRTNLTADERQAKQWTISAIEKRHPEVEYHMDAWANTHNRAGTYIESLGAALRAIKAI